MVRQAYKESFNDISKLAKDVLAIFPTFLAHWVWEKFHIPITTHNNLTKNVNYIWLLSKKDLPRDRKGNLIESFLEEMTQMNNFLQKADDFVKRARLIVLITYDDMMDKDEGNSYSDKVKLMLRGIIRLEDKIVETMKDDKQRVNRNDRLPDDFVPSRLQDCKDPKERIMRDWIFFRTVQDMLETMISLHKDVKIDTK